MTIILVPIDTVPVTNFLQEVGLHLPMAPVWEIERCMKLAIRDFCRETTVWRQRNTVLLTTVANQEDYAANLPSGTELVAVLSAFLSDGTELEVALPGEEEDFAPSERSSAPTDWLIGVDSVDDVRVIPAPSVAGTVVKGTIALSPNEDAEDVPAVVWRRWRTPVAHGCIAKMLDMRGKPWSGTGGEIAYHREKYEEGANECAVLMGPRRRRGLDVRIWR